MIRIIAVCFLLLASGSELLASQKGVKPLWTASLDFDGEPGGINVDVAGPGGAGLIAFGAREELVALAHRRIEVGKLCQRVRAIALDAESGRVRGTRDWTTYGASSVYGTAEGEYGVLDRGTSLLTAGLVKEIAHIDQDVRGISPAGKRFLATSRPNKVEVWSTLDARTLGDVEVLRIMHRPSISDQDVAYLRLSSADGPSVRIQTPGKEPVEYRPKWGVGEPYFASNSVVIIVGDGHFDAISTEGRRLFTGKTRDEEPFMTASRDGRRIAFVERIYRGGQEELVQEDIRVLDLNDGHVVWSLNHKALQGEHESVSQVALAPDGTAIAVLSLGQVMLFRLP